MTAGDEYRAARDRVSTMRDLGRGGWRLLRWLDGAIEQWEKDHDPVESLVLAVARAINHQAGERP